VRGRELAAARPPGEERCARCCCQWLSVGNATEYHEALDCRRVDLRAQRLARHGGSQRSEDKLTLRLVRPTGEILFVGEGIGRPKNTISSPEKAAGEVAERIFEKAFKP
jgi:hypothetical protein